LLPAAWVDEATRSHVTTRRENPDWSQGYGFQFWRCRHGAYRGDGAFGQYCVVLPEQDTVLAITSGLKDMQAPLNLVWQHLLPAFRAAPLASDPAAEQALQARLSSLKVAAPAGSPESPRAAEISGRTFTLEPNELGYQAITFDFAPDASAITLRNDRGEHRLAAGLSGEWLRTTTPFSQSKPETIAVTAAWPEEAAFAFRLCSTETPYCPTLTCRFEGEQITVEYVPNCGFRSELYPLLIGTASGRTNS
jgi:hypothetical protein